MKEIGRFEKAKNKYLLVSEDAFKGMEMIDIREFVKRDKEFIPTKHGIKMQRHLLPYLIELLGKVHSSNQI